MLQVTCQWATLALVEVNEPETHRATQPVQMYGNGPNGLPSYSAILHIDGFEETLQWTCPCKIIAVSIGTWFTNCFLELWWALSTCLVNPNDLTEVRRKLWTTGTGSWAPHQFERLRESKMWVVGTCPQRSTHQFGEGSGTHAVHWQHCPLVTPARNFRLISARHPPLGPERDELSASSKRECSRKTKSK